MAGRPVLFYITCAFIFAGVGKKHCLAVRSICEGGGLYGLGVRGVKSVQPRICWAYAGWMDCIW